MHYAIRATAKFKMCVFRCTCVSKAENRNYNRLIVLINIV